MIIKFDGVDGCGKSALCKAVAETLGRKGSRVVTVSEFSSPVSYSPGSSDPIPVATMRIREAALDPTFDCDDIERQLLLHFLSRRKNRVEIPHLDGLHDYVIVDRSTLSNYAYGAALSPHYVTLSDFAIGDMESANQIFWIDTPVDLCIERMAVRRVDAVEQKGRYYFDLVREQFERLAVSHRAVYRIDGRFEISVLVEQVLAVVEGRNKDV